MLGLIFDSVNKVITRKVSLFIYLFTSFSGHRPAQRECARTRLIGPMQGTIPAQSHNP